jgi:hypothetical protein
MDGCGLLTARCVVLLLLLSIPTGPCRGWCQGAVSHPAELQVFACRCKIDCPGTRFRPSDDCCSISANRLVLPRRTPHHYHQSTRRTVSPTVLGFPSHPIVTCICSPPNAIRRAPFGFCGCFRSCSHSGSRSGPGRCCCCHYLPFLVFFS